VPTNVGYKEADVAIVRNQELIKITSNSTHRLIHRSDFQTSYLRGAFWKDRELQLPGNRKLIVQQE
jgi:hypothetical protein